jgi:hypothetical protein
MSSPRSAAAQRKDNQGRQPVRRVISSLALGLHNEKASPDNFMLILHSSPLSVSVIYPGSSPLSVSVIYLGSSPLTVSVIYLGSLPCNYLAYGPSLNEQEACWTEPYGTVGQFRKDGVRISPVVRRKISPCNSQACIDCSPQFWSQTTFSGRASVCLFIDSASSYCLGAPALPPNCSCSSASGELWGQPWTFLSKHAKDNLIPL